MWYLSTHFYSVFHPISVLWLYNKQCQWLFSAPAAICSYHTYEWASIQSFVSAQIPQSSAAVPAPVQSERLPLRQKSHSFRYWPASKMFCGSASVRRSWVLRWKMLLHIWINFLILVVTLVHRWTVCFFLLILYPLPSSPWPDPRAALSDPERPRGCFCH